MVDAPGNVVLRSKKNTLVEVPGTPGWIVRRYKPKGIHSLVRNSVMVSKERNAFTFALEYEKRGVPTAPVLAILERYSKGVFRESVLVTRKIPCRTLKDWLLEAEQRDAETRDPGRGRRAWLRAFVKFVRRAHEAGVYHGDLNPTNVLVPVEWSAPSPDAFVIVDVNRTRFGLPGDVRLVVADLMRIGATPDERRYVMRAYAADAKEYARLARRVNATRALHDTRKKLNRKLGVKKALVALRLR